MSDTNQISKSDAIGQVIADTKAFDFADIVNAVHQRFRIEVTAAQVEEVYRELKEGKEVEPAQSQIPQPRTTVSMVASVPTPRPAKSPEPATETASSSMDTTVETPDDFDHALQFVKSVGGLARARQVLNEFESALLGSG